MQPEDALAYALAHSQSSTREISEHCGLRKSDIWTIFNEVGAPAYWLTPVQELVPGYVQKRYVSFNFIMNSIDVQPTFLADII